MASIPTPPKMIQTTAYQPLSHHARPLATGAPASAGLAAAVQAGQHVSAPGLVAVLVQRPVMAAQAACQPAAKVRGHIQADSRSAHRVSFRVAPYQTAA